LYRGKRFDGSDGPADLLQSPSYFEFYMAVAAEGSGGFARTYTFWMDDRAIAARSVSRIRGFPAGHSRRL